MTIAADAFFVADRLRKCLPQRNTDIFDGMVRIDVQIADRFYLKIDQSVTGNLIEHVIQKRHAGIELLLTGAIRLIATRICVSLVLRDTAAMRG
jgi:hypothetical protein